MSKRSEDPAFSSAKLREGMEKKHGAWSMEHGVHPRAYAAGHKNALYAKTLKEQAFNKPRLC